MLERYPPFDITTVIRLLKYTLSLLQIIKTDSSHLYWEEEIKIIWKFSFKISYISKTSIVELLSLELPMTHFLSIFRVRATDVLQGAEIW